MIFQVLKQTTLAIALLLFFATASQAQMRLNPHKGVRIQDDLSQTINAAGTSGEQKEMMIPNAFTPNADGINDFFQPVYEGEIQDYSMIIFDRSGRQVFAADNLRSSWDGKLRGSTLHTGVYVYGISYLDEKGEKQVHSGSITLLR